MGSMLMASSTDWGGIEELKNSVEPRLSSYTPPTHVQHAGSYMTLQVGNVSIGPHPCCRVFVPRRRPVIPVTTNENLEAVAATAIQIWWPDNSVIQTQV